MAKRTPSSIAEFPLRVGAADERALAVRFEAHRHLYNACLGESLKRLSLMRESRDWQRACSLPRSLGKDSEGKPIPNPDRPALFRRTAERFGFTAASVQKYAEGCRDACWIGDHAGSHDTQTTSLRAFRAVQQHAFGKRGRPRYKGRNRFHSVEGKGNAVILFRWRDEKPFVLWDDLVLRVLLDPRDRDDWQKGALSDETKSVRIVRRTLRGRVRWYAQLVQKGQTPCKVRRPFGVGVVGGDMGPTNVAFVSERSATLEPLCPGVGTIAKEVRRLQRAMDRSRRATNPEAFNPDGTYRKGARIKVRSNRYRALAARKADAERRLAAERKRGHGELGNRVVAQGNIVKVEKISFRSFQKNFGRSVGRRAPASCLKIIGRKAARAGGRLIEFPTRTTRLSQFSHDTGEYVKKPLSQRWHVFADGSRVQRDLYSAWLARFVEGGILDASRCSTHWG